MRSGTTLYILSGNLSSTPRALKNIITLREKVLVSVVNRTPAWQNLDRKLFAEHQIEYTSVNLWRKPILRWFFTSLLHQLFRIAFQFIKGSVRINALSSEKSSILLINHLKKFRVSCSQIRGHGYGAIYPAWVLSKKWNTPFMIDIEDYHPGEFIRRDAKNERIRRELLLKSILPDALFISFASPLIARRTIDLVGPLKNYNVILNSFPSNEFRPPEQLAGPLKMIWFSQKITGGRGLEQLFSALKSLKRASWELSLVGDIDQWFLNTIPLELRSNINVLPVRSQKDLHQYLSGFDLGLALEQGNLDENRDLCLTNKLLAYTQAGLYILATNTSAQKEFINEDPDRGMVCKQDEDDIVDSIKMIIKSLPRIRSSSLKRYDKGHSVSWEKEARKIMS